MSQISIGGASPARKGRSSANRSASFAVRSGQFRGKCNLGCIRYTDSMMFFFFFSTKKTAIKGTFNFHCLYSRFKMAPVFGAIYGSAFLSQNVFIHRIRGGIIMELILRWIVPVFLAWEVWWLVCESRFIPTSHARDLKSKTTWRRRTRLPFFNLRQKLAFHRKRQEKCFWISLLELQKQNSHVSYERVRRRSWDNSTFFVSAYLCLLSNTRLFRQSIILRNT